MKVSTNRIVRMEMPRSMPIHAQQFTEVKQNWMKRLNNLVCSLIILQVVIKATAVQSMKKAHHAQNAKEVSLAIHFFVGFL